MTCRLSNSLLRRLFTVMLVSLAASSGFAQAQADNFNQAKLHLANHKLQQAIPILEKLWASDPQNANLNYLLGLCYVKEDKQLKKSVELLETASSIYASDYESGSTKERRAPEYVYYYLTIAYSKTGQCEEALRALNKFYQVYSYQDEYYLVDGQKWVRECNLEKTEEEPIEEDPELAQRVEEEPKPEPETPAKEQTEQEIKEEIKQEIAQERKEPQMKERLIPFSDWDNLRTREVNFTTLNSLYGIQVAALIDLRPTREFENLKNVEVYVDENGIFRYVIGRFLYRRQAETLLAEIRERGYADAFIVDVNQADYDEEVLGLGAENIDWNIQGKVDYRVQIGAFRTIVTSAVAEKYLEIDGIKEIQQNDLTIMTVGGFTTYAAAANYREELKVVGIEDAFVVAFNHGNKIPLAEAKKYTEQKPENEEDSSKSGKEKRKPADF